MQVFGENENTVRLIVQNLDVFLQKSGYETISIEKDGACLFSSIIECLKSKDILVSIDDLYSALEYESLNNFAAYSDSIVHNSTDNSDAKIIHEKYHLLKKGLENYVKAKMWANDIVDLIIPILANAMRIDFLIFEPHSDLAFKFLKHSPSLHDSQNWIALKYKQNHYDAIVVQKHQHANKSEIIFY